MKSPPQTVGFQLDFAHYQLLAKLGKKYQMSPGQYARELVLRALDANEEGIFEALNWLAATLTETKEEVRQGREEVKKLRADVSHDLSEIVKALRQIAGQRR